MPYRQRATMPTFALTPNVGEGDLCKQKLKSYVHGLSHASLQVFFFMLPLYALLAVMECLTHTRDSLYLGATCRETEIIMILRLEPQYA